MTPPRVFRNVLIVLPYGIGDTLFAFPLLKALKKQAGTLRLDALVGSRTEQIVGLSPYVDDIFVIDKDKWKTMPKWKVLGEKLGLLRRFKLAGYDLMVDFSMQPEYAFWAKFWTRTPLRAGFNYKKRNPFLNAPLDIPKEGFVERPVVDYVCEMAGKLGIDLKDRKPELRIPSATQDRSLELLKGLGWDGGTYTIVAAGGGATWGKDAHFKQWPASHFPEFLRLMEKERDPGTIVLLGSAEEKKSEEHFVGLSRHVLNLCGRTNLLQAAAILSKAGLFIGNDGGLAHLAAALDVPVISFFGPADPRVYAPLSHASPVVTISKDMDCRPCYRGFRYKDCPHNSCLTGLTPSEAWQELKKSGFLKQLDGFNLQI
ncbi:MAG: glycosyltransferase family 9 protein [Candidatus Omnitrophota bacterium]